MSTPKVIIDGNVLHLNIYHTRDVELPFTYSMHDSDDAACDDAKGAKIKKVECIGIINALHAELERERARSAGLQAKADALDKLDGLIKQSHNGEVVIGDCVAMGEPGITVMISNRDAEPTVRNGPTLAAALTALRAAGSGNGQKGNES